jgi:hypothetical protein
MTILEEEKQLRSELAKLRPDKRRRYSNELRGRILSWVDRSVAEGTLETECSKSLRIKTWRFVMWRRAIVREAPPKEMRSSLALVPIEPLVASSGLVLVTPSGYRIEGLRLDHMASLLRELA